MSFYDNTLYSTSSKLWTDNTRDFIRINIAKQGAVASVG